jgi:hypothetical protein
MKRVLLLLAACGGESKDTKSQPSNASEQPVSKEPEDKLGPKHPATLAKIDESGSCTVKVSGSITAEQTSPGGTSRSVTSYWFAPDDKQLTAMFGEDREKISLILNCTGKDINLNILARDKSKAGVPFGPKLYTIERKGELHVMASANKEPLGGLKGTIEITAFDASHIAGTIELEGHVMVDKSKPVKISGTFDYKCPGFSGCAK